MVKHRAYWIGGVLLALCNWCVSQTVLERNDIEKATPIEDPFVRVVDGHLSLDGKRVRYWAWLGHFALEGSNADNYALKSADSAEIKARKIAKQRIIFDDLAQRIDDLGFNCVRYWTVGDCFNHNYMPGDGSAADQMAFSLAALDKRHIKIWFTGFNDLRQISPQDVDLVDDAATADAWRSSVGELKNKGLRAARQVAWDARTRAAMLKRMQYIADWPNKYKAGLRLADDSQIAIWELQNEEWWFPAMAGGAWQQLPKFFRDELQAEWAMFLKKKYGDDAGLRRAWMFLLPGESLEANSILIAPIGGAGSPANAVNDANPEALSILKGSGKQQFTRDDFVRRRGEDVIEFFVGMHVAYKTKVRDEVKKWGKSLAICPLVLDTGNGYQIQAAYMQQFGDAMAMCAYMWGTATDRQQPHFPFISGLEEQPRLSMGIPWLEVGRIPGKPFFVYEFQTSNPDKYRAEIPFRVAALGALQDWDVVGWHLFGRPNSPDVVEPYTAPMSMSHSGSGGPVEGVHYKNDLVEAASMKTAGAIFTSGALMPPPNPTVMTFGRRSLYAPESADYGGSFGELGKLIGPTAFRYGLRMQIDPTKDADHIDGPTAARGLPEACPIRPTQQIEFDWRKGHLVLDTPSAVSYTGFFARHGGPVRFADGITLDNVTVRNEEGVNYPIGVDEAYVSFALVAADGLPLESSKRMMLSLVSSSFNYGMTMDADTVARGDLGYTGKPFEKMNPGGTTPGKPPVAYCIPSARITGAALAGLKWKAVDFHFKEKASGRIGVDGKLIITSDTPIFSVDLSRDSDVGGASN